MTRAPIRFEITKEGQPYVDEPILIAPRRVLSAIATAFGAPPPRPLLVGFNRVPLIWKKQRSKA